MNFHAAPKPVVADPAVIAEWAELLVHDAEDTIDRVDATLAMAEAKVALVRRTMERRRHFNETQCEVC